MASSESAKRKYNVLTVKTNIGVFSRPSLAKSYNPAKTTTNDMKTHKEVISNMCQISRLMPVPKKENFHMTNSTSREKALYLCLFGSPIKPN